VLPVADVHLSEDGRAVLLVVPDMKPVMQLRVDYSITASDGTPLNGPVYLTLNEARPIDLERQGFEKINWKQTLQNTKNLRRTPSPAESTKVVSVKRGRHIYQETGCATCHSLDGSRQVGPSFQGLYGTERAFKNGNTVVADEEYLRQSILHPTQHVVEDYKANMPSYRGILNESELESLIRFIKSLKE
ncbi:MAG: cytochrome c family protein, partial [Salinibacter sp.]